MVLDRQGSVVKETTKIRVRGWI